MEAEKRMRHSRGEKRRNRVETDVCKKQRCEGRTWKQRVINKLQP